MTEHIFDLNLDYNFPKYDLQQNLNLLEKLYSDEFTIKYTLNNKIITFKVNFIKKILPNNTQFYRLIYTYPNKNTKLNPLMIDFIDIISNKLNNNSYINDIHKTNEISGSELLLIALRINQILGVQKTNLIDIAHIKINDKQCDLSFIKLLENNKTFYMKYGFDFEISLTQLPFIRYENLDLLKDKINNLLTNIRKIKITDIIDEYNKTKNLLNNMSDINKFDINKFNIKIDNTSIPTENIEIFVENPIYQKDSIIHECNEILQLFDKYPLTGLEKYKKELGVLNGVDVKTSINRLTDNNITYLYELFIKLFNMNSSDYLILQKYFIENKRTKIIFEDTIISRDYIFDISILLLLRNSYYYSYHFYL